MSNDTKLTGLIVNDGFTVKSVYGCRLVFGSVPLSEFGMLTHGFSKEALIATDIADRIGASLVIGEPGNLDELRKMDLPVSEKRHTDYQMAHGLGLYDLAMWLRAGERGASSNAMCKRMFGLPESAGFDHPHDPSDIRRCIMFLDETKSHDKIQMMSDVSQEWARLVEVWEQLVSTLNAEIKNGKSAPKTYELMKQALSITTAVVA